MVSRAKQKANLSQGQSSQPVIDSPLRQIRKRFMKNKLAVAGLLFLVALVIFSILTPWIAPYDPGEIDLSNIEAPPSKEHWLGTDELGRDVLTRLMYGSRVTLAVGIVSMIIGVAVGCIFGALAGYYGGIVDNAIMRFVDIMLSFPTIFLLIIMASYVKAGIGGIMLIIGLTSWMGVARLVRGEFLSLKEKEFVEASRALGVRDVRVMFRHLLPNAIGPVIVAATLDVGYAILYESSLSFLGIGIQPPAASWGNMLSNAQANIYTAPWLAIWPGLCIFLTVLAFNFVGDGLRDALDPKLKR